MRKTKKQPRHGRGVPESGPVADTVKTTTCYMCACRCGIRVHLTDGRLRYIEGNPDHPVNRGVLCAKGSAGIMQQNSPAKLSKPLLRIGPRGSGQFKEITWEEALATATQWLSAVRWRDPKGLAFFTGRDQSQALTGWWAKEFGTPNYAAHGGFCSVNMAAAGQYTLGGSFWEFGEPDWDHARYLMMLGVAEDHDSNPIKIGLGKMKARGAKIVSVNPVKTGYSAIADEWIGIRPGTDGLFILSLVHELLRADCIDFDYLVRATNAPWLVVDEPGSAGHGLVVRDSSGAPLCWDARVERPTSALDPRARPRLVGRFTQSDGTPVRPVFSLLAERYLDPAYAPEAIGPRVGIAPAVIRRLAAELARAAFEAPIEIPQPWTDWTGRHHESMIGRPVAFHAMRGLSAHSNGFQTCRALHLLQGLLGAIDAPGSWNYKSPCPRPIPPDRPPSGALHEIRPGAGLPDMPLGFPQGPEDLLIDADGQALRIDKAFSWEAPLAVHGLLHMVIRNAHAGDPYPIDTLMLYMANMGWNSAMNLPATLAMLADLDPESRTYRIPRIIYSDAFWSETVAYADLVLPDTTYLERWDCMSLLDRPIGSAEGPADAIRQPVLEPDRDVRPFQDVLLELGHRLGLEGMATPEGSPRYPGGYADYIVHHERKPGIGSLAGWRGQEAERQGTGAPNPDQLMRYIANGCFWQERLTPERRYFRNINRGYLDWAVELGLIGEAEPIFIQLYCEPLQRLRLAAEGHGSIRPPAELRPRLVESLDPLPLWYEPYEQRMSEPGRFPLFAVTQRPMAMYHSWGSQNAWLRQILGSNRLYINRATAERFQLGADDWVWIESPWGRVKAQLQLMEGVNESTVWTWNAVGKRAGAWNLDPAAPEATRGFLLNHLITELLPGTAARAAMANVDPITGQAAWYDLKVSLTKAAPEEAGVTEPRLAALDYGLPRPPRILRTGGWFRERREAGEWP
ncbi:MAG TPA: molybdopterin oxidoreductase family protein [Alphaproteobacteria bacterium]|nr:molybdopterin oxidoreductase family protein [Alphaproteobacteria bacterium]